MDYVTIANIALTKLGQYTSLISLNDNTRPAIVMNAQYENARDLVLSEYDWPFATKKDILAPSVTAPAWGGGNYFQLPSDFISVVGLENPYDTWELEGQFILANTDTLNIKYVYRETDPNKFSPMFVEAYSSYLAYLTSMQITGDEKLKGDMLQIYARDLNRARSFSAIQNSGKTYLSDAFINARVNGTID